MLAPNWMELLVLVGTIGVGAAVLAYLALRTFVWSKAKSESLEHIRKHALWTGIIAWAFSSLAGASLAGVHDPSRLQADPWSTIPWFSILGPAVAVTAVHALGQASWPAPKSPRRTAVLEFRRVRDYVQPALGAALVVLAAGTLLAMRLIASRRSLEALTPEQNKTLRTIG